MLLDIMKIITFILQNNETQGQMYIYVIAKSNQKLSLYKKNKTALLEPKNVLIHYLLLLLCMLHQAFTVFIYQILILQTQRFNTDNNSQPHDMTLSQFNPPLLLTNCPRFICMLSSHLLGLICRHFPRDFLTEILCAFLCSSQYRMTCINHKFLYYVISYSAYSVLNKNYFLHNLYVYYYHLTQ
jgi:hypothetical protein